MAIHFLLSSMQKYIHIFMRNGAADLMRGYPIHFNFPVLVCEDLSIEIFCSWFGPTLFDEGDKHFLINLITTIIRII